MDPGGGVTESFSAVAEEEALKTLISQLFGLVGFFM